MNAMLTDTELEQLLEEAAGSFDVPAPDLDVPTHEKRQWPTWWLKAAAGVAVLTVGTAVALSSGGPRTFSDTSGKLSSAPGGAVGGGTTGGTTGGVAAPGSLAPDALRVPVNGYDQSAGGTASVGSPANADEGDTARIVRTGTISLAVDKGKVPAVVVALENLVTGVRGYEADSTSNEVGDSPAASMTFRVPVTSFPAVIQRVRALKVQILSVQQSGKDVTATYADTQAQIQSLKAARSRYLAILARAKTIGETLTVQQRVDDVQQQIDRLEGQRRVLADQSDFATLTVSVAEKGADNEVLVKPAASGWSKAWHDATHGFSSGVQSLIAASGRTLLVLLCGAALVLLGRAGWRLARRRLV